MIVTDHNKVIQKEEETVVKTESYAEDCRASFVIAHYDQQNTTSVITK